MIRGLHGLLYTSDADASRAFLRDKLKLPFNDVGGGWLIFDLPEADLGVHPTDGPGGGTPGEHDISFYCDDIIGTCAELSARGVEFKHEPQDHGYGWVTYFIIPGGIQVQLYEPKYTKKAKPAAIKPAAPKAKAAVKAKAKRPAAKKPAAKKVAAKKPKAKTKSRKR
jgi:catechol 2,3-dioxygenase-like lactoylglutathione lyase family enzyme